MAGKTVQELIADTSIADTDLLVMNDDPAGTGPTKKITLSDFKKSISKQPTFIVGPGDNADFSDIQDAIDALPAGGGKIFIKAGTYFVPETLILNKSNIWLEGEGEATILTVNYATSTYLIQFGDGVDPYSNIKVTDLKLECSPGGAGFTPNGFEIKDFVASFEISGCTIQNCDQFPLTDGSTNAVKIFSFNTLIDNQNPVRFVNGLCTRVFGNYVTGQFFGGITVETSKNVEVRNNKIEDSGHHYFTYYAIYCYQCKNIIVQGNQLKSLDEYAIGMYECVNFNVIGNIIENCNNSGVQTYHSFYGSIGNNNVYLVNEGLDLSGGEKISVNGNTIVSTVISAIAIYGGKDFNISGNVVYDSNRDGISQYDVISLASATVQCSVVGNTIVQGDNSTRRFGITEYGNGTDYNLIGHNIVKGSFYKHIYAFGRNSLVDQNILRYV